MSIRNHICTAKRFFHRTLDSFKSFLSKLDDSSSYLRLRQHKGYTDADFSFGDEFNFVGEPLECKKPGEKEKTTSADQVRDHVNVYEKKSSSSYKRGCNARRVRVAVEQREARMRKVAQRLKELEMVDSTNADHVLDIDEVFHYYSRLTSPAFLEIVDRFFMEMQAEVMGTGESLEFLQRST